MEADLEEDDGSDLDRAAAKFLRSAWKSSPGLVASLVFHAGMIGVMPFIIFADRIKELAGIPITIGLDAKRLEPEKPYKREASAPPTFDGTGGDEPPQPFPFALAAERNEAPGKQTESERIDGQAQVALEHLTNEPAAEGFRGRLAKGPPGTNDILGVGGGSGKGGMRRAKGLGGELGRENLVLRGGGSAATERAVARGLSWLARHQATDGGFCVHTTCGCMPGERQDMHDVAATSLALVAFMTAGYGPESKVETRDPVTGRMLRYDFTVRAALGYLRSKQVKARFIATQADGSGGIYEHAFATMALCEATRRSKDPKLEEAAKRALETLLDRQNSGAAWQDGAHDGNNDTSVTGACIQALRAAKAAGLAIPRRNLTDLQNFMDAARNSDGSTGYSGAGGSTTATTAIGLYAQHFLRPGKNEDPIWRGLAAKKIERDVGNAQTRTDLYSWYYAMLALFEQDGPKGTAWKSVNEAVTTALIEHQRKGSDCVGGAWDANGDSYLSSEGRPLETAMSVLTLEVYYRFAEVRTAEAPPPATLQSR